MYTKKKKNKDKKRNNKKKIEINFSPCMNPFFSHFNVVLFTQFVTKNIYLNQIILFQRKKLYKKKQLN